MTSKTDLALCRRTQALAQVKAWAEAKGEKHSAKSLHYFDAGFERGWMEAIKLVKEMGGLK
jgi:hypothetical protein